QLSILVCSCSFLRWKRRRLSACIQMIVVERGVEQEHEAALRLLTPHGIVGKKHNVTAAERHIDEGGSAGQFRATGQHAADPQILFVSEAQNDAWIKRGRRQRAAVEGAELRINVKL